MQMLSSNCFHDNILHAWYKRDYLKLWLVFLDVVIELPRTNLWTHYPVWWGTRCLSNELAYHIYSLTLPPSAHTKDHRTWCKQIGLLYLLHESNSIGNNKQNSFVVLLRFVCALLTLPPWGTFACFVDSNLRVVLTLPLGKETMEQCRVDLRNVHKMLVWIVSSFCCGTKWSISY
jgi:hypothetical protein